MTDPIAPKAPSWLPQEPKIEASTDGRNKYTYILKIKDTETGQRKSIAVEFTEKADLTPEALATRELAHLMLLKSMAHIGKRAGSEIFTEGTVIELKTDKTKIVESTSSNISITKPDESTFYYNDDKLDTPTIISSNTKINLLPFQASKHGGDLLHRLDAIRKMYFKEGQDIDLFRKVTSEPPFTEERTIATAHTIPNDDSGAASEIDTSSKTVSVEDSSTPDAEAKSEFLEELGSEADNDDDKV